MKIVVLHAGGLGDLVLAESLLSALRELRPGARIELLCRSEVASVASLYVERPDAVHAFDFNPYRWALPDESVARAIASLLPKLAGEPIDLFISAELRATWLSDVVAAASRARTAIVADGSDRGEANVAILLRKLDISAAHDARHLEPVEGEHELDRYARLAGARSRRIPNLRRSRATQQRETELLVFPAGAPELKRWPLDALAKAARDAAAGLGARVVLVGSAAERAHLEALTADGPFGPDTDVLTGTPAQLPTLARRIATARAYVGIDTGLAHLAAAYDVPGLTIYGGGTWPAYAPWRSTSGAVLAPIPCFGCGWDCAFDHAFCIDGVDLESVQAAFAAVLEGSRSEPLVRRLDAYTARERLVFAAAAAVHRTAQTDRAARLTAITRIRDVLRRYAVRTRRRHVHTKTELRSLSGATKRAAARLTALKDSAP